MIFRAVTNVGKTMVAAATTPRAPGNVPFLVDNLWEWLRPSEMPCRRYSAFASPTRQQAAASAGLTIAHVRAVRLTPGARACQIVGCERPEDARYHPDVGVLMSLVRKQFPRDWFARPVSDRWPEAALFMPCATADEIDDAFTTSSFLDAADVRDKARFWSHVQAIEASATTLGHAGGEIFFEGAYELFEP